MLLQVESQATPQRKIVLASFLVRVFIRAPPGQGSANVRAARSSPLWRKAQLLFGLLWRSTSPISSSEAPLPEQVCRQGMTEQVRLLRAESTPERISARLTIVETVMECAKPRTGALVSKENPATGTVRPAGVQIERDMLTDVGQQRQLVTPTSALAPDCDPAVVPIDVLQVQRNDLAGSHRPWANINGNCIVALSTTWVFRSTVG